MCFHHEVHCRVRCTTYTLRMDHFTSNLGPNFPDHGKALSDHLRHTPIRLPFAKQYRRPSRPSIASYQRCRSVCPIYRPAFTRHKLNVAAVVAFDKMLATAAASRNRIGSPCRGHGVGTCGKKQTCLPHGTWT